MKKLAVAVAIPMLLVPFAFAELTLPRVSQKATVMQTVGLTDLTILYNRPGVKGRTIWGELVPYDKVWRTGANEATTVNFTHAVKVDGKPLPAGIYSIHTIPGKSSWTVIFNKKAEQWGSYAYDAANDALRIQVAPKSGAHQEWMTFSFPDVANDAATLELSWEKVRIPLRIETDTTAQALANIREALSGEVKDWEVPYDAASFAFTAKLDNSRADALGWIEKSIALDENYWNLRLKASMLEKEGKRKEAIAVAEKAVKIGKEKKDEASEIAKTEKQIAEWKAAAGM